MSALPHAKLTTQPMTGATRRPGVVRRVLGGWLSRHRSRQHLSQLDAHMLRDIGLNAQDVSFETCKPFWRD
jgi:uncharacterized protein YjiS (DUF1127 family)